MRETLGAMRETGFAPPRHHGETSPVQPVRRIARRGFQPAMSPHARTRNLAALATLAMSTLAAGAASASPALEYGPEAEARFLECCDPVAAADPMAPAAAESAARCRRLSEGLQERLGYAAFLANAAGGPAAFDLAAATASPSSLSSPPPAVLLSAEAPTPR
jgi:hypothetical protein